MTKIEIKSSVSRERTKGLREQRNVRCLVKSRDRMKFDDDGIVPGVISRSRSRENERERERICKFRTE